MKTKLQDLAKEYLELASQDINTERRELRRKVNDLESERPVVLIDEIPWNEIAHDSLKLISEDPFIRASEDFLRKRIYQFRHFPGDMVLRPFLAVNKIIRSTGIGIEVEEQTLEYETGNNIVAHEYIDQFSRDEDLEKLKMPVITYDKTETERRVSLLNDVYDGIIDVVAEGLGRIHVGTWDDISEYRGVSPLLIDLLDRPDFTHKLVRRLTDIQIHTMKQYEELGLLDTGLETLHCTASETGDMPALEEDGKVRLKNVWGRGVAQILASASKEMREEFDIEYMKETVGLCGMTYYGCCEPLDTMIDIVEKIPNLRKISVTPWADSVNAAEVIGSRYVYASKPNPASVAVYCLDKDNMKKEQGTIMEA
ncbi:MAG: hypothetical protein PQJ58_00355 [Spirochaetales bacterium]|nr:hypothetical protein [Spirochaetales bacterium]